jgi:hypothetical protein
VKEERNMSTYTVRVTEENGQFICWIDKNGQICIKQPFDHEISGEAAFTTAESAQAYGDKWAAAYAKIEQDAEAESQAIAQAKASAEAKLAAIGLTAEEIAALSK